MDIPDYFCCKITMELMEEPVTTQAGLTYEKSALDDHLNRNGNTDPVTREPINPEAVVPNHNLKQAIDVFLHTNPWAFEFMPGETYKDIKFV
mmetsp:Transcript_33256/g.30198  ORF Transcript_33256/g.30198 Transcript_33256/m.30198 type:complete len:92 (-) Transcript_33256:136-411(-)